MLPPCHSYWVGTERHIVAYWTHEERCVGVSDYKLDALFWNSNKKIQASYQAVEEEMKREREHRDRMALLLHLSIENCW